MAWGRLDDGFDDHPKVVAMLDEDDQTMAAAAIGLWTLCLAWAHRNTRKRGKVAGLLPAGLPRRFIGPVGKDAAQLLVKHRLWDAQDDGGWLIHDFEGYLPTEETRTARSEAGKRGAEARWGNKPKADEMKATEPSIDSNADGNLPSDSHDVDSNPVANDGSRAPARWAISKEIAPTPIPIPEPKVLAPESVTQRSKRITDAYHQKVPLSKWPAINTMVIKAIKAETWTDKAIHAALIRMADDKRVVTVDALRVELDGPPKSRSPAQPYHDDPTKYDNDEGL